MNTIIEFIEFLKREEVYEDFVRNMKNDNFFEPYTDETPSPENFICASFIFNDTPEGSKFWLNIEDKWFDIIEQLKAE